MARPASADLLGVAADLTTPPPPGPGTAGGGRGSAGLCVVLLADELRLDLVLPAHVALAELDVEIRELAVRAGARVGPQTTVVRVGHGPLDPALPLAGQGVRDGDLLSLQAVDAPVALRLHHDLAEAVAEVVGGARRQVDPVLRLRAATVLAGLAACSAALLAPGAGTVGLLLTTLTWCAAAAVLHRVRRRGAAPGEPGGAAPGPGQSLVVLVLVTVLLVDAVAWAVCAEVGWGTTWPTGSGFLLASGLTAGLLICSGPGVREWAAVPGVVAVAWGVVPLLLDSLPGTLALDAGAVRSALLVLLVLGAGQVVRVVVDVLLVRPTRLGARGAVAQAPAEPLRSDVVRSGVAAATGLVLALDVATVLLAVAVVPGTVLTGASGPSWTGLAFWLALAGTLLLRAGSEWLAARAVTGWLGGAGVLLVGLLQLGTAAGGWQGVGWVDGGGVDGVVLAQALCAAACLAGLWGAAVVVGGGGGAAGARRVQAVLDVALRLALPSLWLLSSGVLG